MHEKEGLSVVRCSLPSKFFPRIETDVGLRGGMNQESSKEGDSEPRVRVNLERLRSNVRISSPPRSFPQENFMFFVSSSILVRKVRKWDCQDCKNTFQDYRIQTFSMFQLNNLESTLKN